jgi:glycopeptide antibiotics resistance protein
VSGSRRSWPIWVVIIAIASGPWFGIVHRPQWERVTWIPFHGSEDRPRDMLVNFLLFVPFGWSLAKTRSVRGSLGTAILAAAIVSIAVEIPQLFYRLRDPSATDVFMAMCGAAGGSIGAKALYGRDPGGAARGREAGEAGRP